jgi:hypothetical protein
MQIAGGGRVRLKKGESIWWGTPPKGRAEVFETKEICQVYGTREAAEQVANNLATGD